MSEPQRKRGRPAGREFPERLVMPCTPEFKQQVIDAAEAAGVPAAAWARQAIQDRLNGVVRIDIGGNEALCPLDYPY